MVTRMTMPPLRQEAYSPEITATLAPRAPDLAKKYGGKVLGGGEVRAEWQESPKMPARLQPITATADGSRWQSSSAS